MLVCFPFLGKLHREIQCELPVPAAPAPLVFTLVLQNVLFNHGFLCVQVQHFGAGHQEWNGNFGHRRQQAYIPTSVTSNPFTLSHGSPNHTAVHAHLAGSSHLGGQPALLPYPSSATLSSAAPVAHLLASPCTSRPMLQHPTYSISHPSGIVHQVPVGINPRLLPSPTIHQTQYKPIFPPHSYIAASPAYTGFPLSPTKLSQYPYM